MQEIFQTGDQSKFTTSTVAQLAPKLRRGGTKAEMEKSQLQPKVFGNFIRSTISLYSVKG